MERTVNSNRFGFTLVELLVSLLILSVGILGLMQTVNNALRHNLENTMRHESINIADSFMVIEKAKPFALISTPSSTPAAQRTRGYANVSRQIYSGFKNYSVTRTGDVVTSNTKQVEFEVSWRHKDKRYTHSIVTLVSQYEQ